MKVSLLSMLLHGVDLLLFSSPGHGGAGLDVELRLEPCWGLQDWSTGANGVLLAELVLVMLIIHLAEGP